MKLYYILFLNIFLLNLSACSGSMRNPTTEIHFDSEKIKSGKPLKLEFDDSIIRVNGISDDELIKGFINYEKLEPVDIENFPIYEDYDKNLNQNSFTVNLNDCNKYMMDSDMIISFKITEENNFFEFWIDNQSEDRITLTVEKNTNIGNPILQTIAKNDLGYFISDDLKEGEYTISLLSGDKGMRGNLSMNCQ